jgi:hypothetical protein
MKPTYLNNKKRWRYNSLNSKMGLNEKEIPLFDERMIVDLKTVLNRHRLIETDELYHSFCKVEKPFLVTHERKFYPGDTSSLVENDPVNAIESALDTSIHGNPELEAERMIGNIRLGVKRNIVHIGDGLSISEYADLETLNPSTVPFFPPLPTFPGDPDVDPFVPHRTSLVSTDSGFKEYIKGDHPTVGKSSRKAQEMTGYKTIIWDKTMDEFLPSVDTTEYPISADDSKNVELADIETVLNGASSKGGLADIHANLGTFLPDENSWTIINIPGQFILEMTETKFSARLYNSGFSTVLSKIEIDKSTGDILMDAGSNDVDINGATVRINGTPQ